MFVKNFYYYYTKLFSDQFCDYVIRKGKELVEQDGKVGSFGKGKKDNKIRDSKITWIKDRDILEPVLQTIEAANRKAEWDFHLDLNLGITAQFTKYGLNQFYHWHRDCDISNRNRKLSFILNLSVHTASSSNINIGSFNSIHFSHNLQCDQKQPTSPLVILVFSIGSIQSLYVSNPID